MSTSYLLDLPAELRDHIWHLVFQDVDITPFATLQNKDWFFYPARRRCHACPEPGSQTLPPTKKIFAPLLSCKQMYQEASPIYRSSVCLHISKPEELEVIRSYAQRPLRCSLLRLDLVLHLKDSNRDQWMRELRNLPIIFPSLQRLDIRNHMRPPISFQNLSDAVYFAGPIVQFPQTLKPQLQFAYVEDDEMFSSEELGIIYYRDALEAHESVLRVLMADPQFKEDARTTSLEPMINRLMHIAQSHEESWLESIRRKRRQSGDAGAASGLQV